jgi:hypothetical protein
MRVCAISLLLIAAHPSPARAKQDPEGADGLPANNPKHPWKMLSSTPRADTLCFALSDIIPVAIQRFEIDRWEIFTLDGGQGQIVTRWKAMHHPLLRLFMGRVNARCTVRMRPLGANLTRLEFQADLASHHDLRGSPMFGAVTRAYAKAARNYVAEVRDSLDTRRARSSPP